MPIPISRRKFLGTGASLSAISLLSLDPTTAQAGSVVEGSDVQWLNSFAEEYLRVMHAPGMIVGCATRSQLYRGGYGYSNLDSKQPLALHHAFCIGSITKSFTAVVAMQLREEGKLDLHRPVLDILPSLPITNQFGPITAHHLLTHTSGLSNWHYLVSSDPREKATQAYKPGVHFSYCNLGFDAMGLLIAHIEGKLWPEVVQARVLDRLEMTSAAGRINAVTQTRLAVGYQYFFIDRPGVVAYPLSPSTPLTTDRSAGGVTATALDMAKYIQMFASGGGGPHGRILSEESMKLLSTPHIRAHSLGPNTHYGYGIAVETIDGHKMLWHTGGMTGFASSIKIDLEAGVGAFASINAMQGYRPNPITLLAVRTLRARQSKSSLPAAPAIPNPLVTSNAADYAGSYQAPGGEGLVVSATGNRLSLQGPHGLTALYPLGSDSFSAADGTAVGDAREPGVTAPVPSEYALCFERAADPQSPVVALSIGSCWYAGTHYAGPRAFNPWPNAQSLTGKYFSDNPWYGLVHIVERNGKLWLDGIYELRPEGDHRFVVETSEDSIAGESIRHLEFHTFIDGRASLLRMEGEGFRRVEV